MIATSQLELSLEAIQRFVLDRQLVGGFVGSLEDVHGLVIAAELVRLFHLSYRFDFFDLIEVYLSDSVG